MSLIIREIEEKDYLALLPLWNNELGVRTVTAENIAPRYNRVKNDDSYKTFVAILEDQVVGFVSSLQSYGVASDCSYMQIIGIAVAKEMHNHGIGTQLLNHIENYGRDNSILSVFLCSGVKRTDAHAFYQRNGYSKDNSWCFDKKL